MKYLIDTNIIIGFLKNEQVIVDFFEEIDLVNVSIISVGEMYFGALRSKSFQKNIKIYQSLFSYCNILGINEKTADCYANLKKELWDKGKPIPENDLWIAANALENDLAIATRDKHFATIHSLNIINF